MRFLKPEHPLPLDFEGVFWLLAEKSKRSGRKLVVAIDEFPDLLESWPGLAGHLRRWIDLHPEANVLFIFAGSSLSLMRKAFEDRNQPLFGRAHGTIDLGPFAGGELTEIFREVSPERLFRIYATIGGTPYCWKIWKETLGFERDASLGEVLDLFWEPPQELQTVLTFALQAETRATGRHLSMLRELARRFPYGTGATKLARAAEIQPTSVSKYLDTLSLLGLARKVPVPFQDEKWKLTEFLVAFWGKFVAPLEDVLKPLPPAMRERILRSQIPRPREYFSQAFEEAQRWWWRPWFAGTEAVVGEVWLPENQIDLAVIRQTRHGKKLLLALEAKFEGKTEPQKAFSQLEKSVKELAARYKVDVKDAWLGVAAPGLQEDIFPEKRRFQYGFLPSTDLVLRIHELAERE